MISLTVPVYNEREALGPLFEKVRAVMEGHGKPWEIIFVNDGSTDNSLEIIRRAALLDPRVRAINFSRNFGHQAAITAGLDFAEGEAVAVMDADLQDPPELLPQMLELLKEGYDVVSPRRISREGETLFKKWTAAFFYRVMARIVNGNLSVDVGDFRLFSRRAVLAIRSFRERHRFMRGLVAWLGLKEAVLPFERQPRAAGETKYSTWKMLRFAWTAISSFSALPLRLSIAAGVILSCSGFLYMFRVMYLALFTRTLVPGWASIVVLQCIFSGMILLALGAIGDYVARTYEQSKGRPLYVVGNAVNCDTIRNEMPSASLVLVTENNHVPAIRFSA
jgi:glycosyltransferase involved in cell wall biosynthesis